MDRICQTVEVRQSFAFASSVEVLRDMQVYCTSYYGDFNGYKAVQYFNSWTTLMKLTWDCPRATRTYLVQQVLACGHISAKTEVMARFTKFFQGLRSSPSREVATLANLLARDIRSSTGRNVRTISELTGKSPWSDTAASMRIKLAEAEAVVVADMDKWRIGYLGEHRGSSGTTWGRRNRRRRCRLCWRVSASIS